MRSQWADIACLTIGHSCTHLPLPWRHTLPPRQHTPSQQGQGFLKVILPCLPALRGCRSWGTGWLLTWLRCTNTSLCWHGGCCRVQPGCSLCACLQTCHLQPLTVFGRCRQLELHLCRASVQQQNKAQPEAARLHARMVRQGPVPQLGGSTTLPTSACSHTSTAKDKLTSVSTLMEQRWSTRLTSASGDARRFPTPPSAAEGGSSAGQQSASAFRFFPPSVSSLPSAAPAAGWLAASRAGGLPAASANVLVPARALEAAPSVLSPPAAAGGCSAVVSPAAVRTLAAVPPSPVGRAPPVSDTSHDEAEPLAPARPNARVSHSRYPKGSKIVWLPAQQGPLYRLPVNCFYATSY